MTHPVTKIPDEDLACTPGKWLICSDPSGIDGDAGYVMHRFDPMFICRWSEDEVVASDAFLHNFESGHRLTLHDFNFSNDLPDRLEFRRICVDAVRVIDSYLKRLANQ